MPGLKEEINQFKNIDPVVNAAFVEAIALCRHDLFDLDCYDSTMTDLHNAWEQWDERILQRFYSGNKPKYPTYGFRKAWIMFELDTSPDSYRDLIEGFRLFKPRSNTT